MDTERYFVNDLDRRIWEEELEEFVPARVFDAHTHIWSEANALPETEKTLIRTPVSAADLVDWSRKIYPGRELGFMIMGSPVLGMNFAADRAWCVAEAAATPNSVCAVIVTPELTPETLDAEATRGGFRALKPYRLYASDPVNCAIRDFLPESLIEVADHHKLMVVMHLSGTECAADPRNLADLAYFAGRYPNVTWQLAHCARCFNACFLEESIHVLKNLPNICYDLSAVCDDRSIYLLFKHEDRTRLMYGSDNVSAGSLHGKYVTYGRSWDWYPQQGGDNAILICYEQLRAMRRAAEYAQLTESEIADIFYYNARRIYLGEKR